MLGWKEFELELLRDKTIMASFFHRKLWPHGRSYRRIVLPWARLWRWATNLSKKKMRTMAIKMMRSIGNSPVAAMCSLPWKRWCQRGNRAIEINPRVSRSSALASQNPRVILLHVPANTMRQSATNWSIRLQNPLSLFEPTLWLCNCKNTPAGILTSLKAVTGSWASDEIGWRSDGHWAQFSGGTPEGRASK